MRLLFLILFISAVCVLQAQTFVFRYDDVVLSNDLRKDPVIELFEEYKIPLNIAVIPFSNTVKPLDETVQYVKHQIKKGLLDIQLHGFTHRASDSSANEFYKSPLDVQITMLKAGKAFLDSLLQINISGFVPPLDLYDVNTITALDSLKFKFLSAGKYGSFIKSNIEFLPATATAQNGLCDLIKEAKFSKGIVVVLLHSADIKDSETFHRLNECLKKLVEKKHECVTFSSIIKNGKMFTYDWARRNSNLTIEDSHFPVQVMKHIFGYPHQYFLVSKDEITRLNNLKVRFALVSVLFIAIIVLLAARVIRK